MEFQDFPKIARLTREVAPGRWEEPVRLKIPELVAKLVAAGGKVVV